MMTKFFKSAGEFEARGARRTKLRGVIGAALALTLCAHVPAYANELGASDHRFDLAPYNMPPILTSDAKKCISVGQLVRGQKAVESEIGQKMFERVLDYWEALNKNVLAGQSVGDVLPFGGEAKKVKSILPSLLKTPEAIGHACGKYAGGVIAKIGILSLRDGIEAAMAVDPDVFKKQGVDMDVLDAGMKLLDGYAAALNDVSANDTVDCVAIFQIAKIGDPSFEPASNVWIAAMVNAIESGKLDAGNIRQQSPFWRALLDGAEALAKVEGMNEKAEQCQGWLNAAVAKSTAK